MKEVGFEREVERVKKGLCPLCEKEIDLEKGFRDNQSIREWRISGMCQQCQDEVFGEGGE